MVYKFDDFNFCFICVDSDTFLVVLNGAMVLGENSDWICPQGEMLCKLNAFGSFYEMHSALGS